MSLSQVFFFSKMLRCSVSCSSSSSSFVLTDKHGFPLVGEIVWSFPILEKFSLKTQNLLNIELNTRTSAALETMATSWIHRRGGRGQAERASVCPWEDLCAVGTLVFSKAPFLHAVKRTALPVRDENISSSPPPPLAWRTPWAVTFRVLIKLVLTLPMHHGRAAGAGEARVGAAPPFTSGAAQCSDNMLTGGRRMPPHLPLVTLFFTLPLLHNFDSACRG